YFPATGRDNQEKIKYFIKNAIESWTTGNILLVGGSSKVPVRETHVYISIDDSEIFVSDLYYADIYNGTGGFSSWDTNSNNIFGEYKWAGQTDIVDLHPDVYLARLPATSTSQVTTCVNKIKTYENTPGYQQSWFPNLVVVGGDSFEDNAKIDEGEYSNQKVIDVMTGFAPNKLWASNGKLTSLIPTGLANIKSAINDGCGFVDFDGHANTYSWACHPHDNFAIWIPTPSIPGGIENSDVLTLSNGNKLPIVTVKACSTAKFAEDPACFNWAFLYNSNGGAIGTFGATGLGYGGLGTSYTQGTIGKVGLDTYKAYKLDQSTTFGEIWSKALNRYIKSSMDDVDYKTVEEWQAFGDPTLAIGEKSNPPAKPATPNGPASGGAGTEYTYTSSTTDPDGDKVSYMFDWGDGTFSGWVGPINSGVVASAKKTWSVKGTYQVKVVAKDTHGILSVWSDSLPITMPRSYEMPFLHLLERLFEQFPHMFPVLRHLLGY
ncbi:MAG: C25 family cysteine peptidase, partial [Euryarchaeota archaeon]|nr:C25 family cysteine peptidase [Euryarchaeota archaeon]